MLTSKLNFSYIFNFGCFNGIKTGGPGFGDSGVQVKENIFKSIDYKINT